MESGFRPLTAPNFRWDVLFFYERPIAMNLESGGFQRTDAGHLLISRIQSHSNEDIHAPGMLAVVGREGAFNHIGCCVCADAGLNIPKEWDITCVPARKRAQVESVLPGQLSHL